MRRGHLKLLLVIVASLLVVAIVVASSYYTTLQAPENQEKAFCTVDEDCVPAQCCHPTSAVNKQFAPSDCKGVFCTTVCVPNTLDCGQGEIKCIKNKCEVVLK